MATFRTPQTIRRRKRPPCSCAARKSRCFAVLGALIACLAHAPVARADPTEVASLTWTGLATPARLMGGVGSGGHLAAVGNGGPLLAVEGAWATTLASGADAAQGAGAFGARAGWALPSGLAVHLRYDDLGVEPSGLRSPLQLATAGLRYSVPFIVPLPFAEVDAGPAFVGPDVRFGAGAALGASLPLGQLVLLDVAAHDWLVPVGGSLRQTLTVGLGLAVTFASPGR